MLGGEEDEKKQKRKKKKEEEEEEEKEKEEEEEEEEEEKEERITVTEMVDKLGKEKMKWKKKQVPLSGSNPRLLIQNPAIYYVNE